MRALPAAWPCGAPWEPAGVPPVEQQLLHTVVALLSSLACPVQTGDGTGLGTSQSGGPSDPRHTMATAL